MVEKQKEETKSVFDLSHEQVQVIEFITFDDWTKRKFAKFQSK